MDGSQTPNKETDMTAKIETKEEEINKATGLREVLSVGLWILMPYGFENRKFCILEKTETKVLMGMPGWCVSDAEWFSIADLEQKDGTILGKGRYRWWRLILPVINDMIFPYSANR